MNNKNLVNNCVKYVMLSGIIFAILKKFPNKNFSNMEIFVITSIIIIGIFSLDCMTSSNIEKFSSLQSTSLPEINVKSIFPGGWTSYNFYFDGTLKLKEIGNETNDLVGEMVFRRDTLTTFTTISVTGYLGQSGHGAFYVGTKMEFAKSNDSLDYYDLVTYTFPGGYKPVQLKSDKNSPIITILPQQVIIEEEDRNQLQSKISQLQQQLVEEETNSSKYNQIKNQLQATNAQLQQKLIEEEQKDQAANAQLQQKLIEEEQRDQASKNQLQSNISKLQQQLLIEEEQGNTNSSKYNQIKNQLQAANAQLQQKLIEEEQRDQASKNQLQSNISKLQQQLLIEEEQGNTNSSKYNQIKNQLQAANAQLQQKLIEEEQATENKLKSTISQFKKEMTNQKKEDVVSCEVEVAKMKQHLEITISQLRQELKNSERNYYNAKISEKYMKHLISDLESKYIIDKTDIFNLEAKVGSGTHTIEEIIQKLETLKEKGKFKSPKDKSNDMKYSELPSDFYIPLGSQISNKWDENNEFNILNTNKWNVPQRKPPSCVTKGKYEPCDVCPMNSGYPAPLKDFDNSRHISNIKINKRWALDQIDDDDY